MAFFILLVMVGSVAVALLRGQSLEEVAGRSFRWWGTLALGLALHVVVGLRALAGFLSNRPLGLALPLGSILYLASFVFLLGFVARNLSCPGFPALLAGLALNCAVIALNHGQMPGEPSQLAAAGRLDVLIADLAAGLWRPFALIGPATPMAWFGDRILVPLPWHQPVVVSIGDLFVALGCFFFFNNPFGARYRFSARRRYGAL